MDDEIDWTPPPGPPPLLAAEQIRHLAEHGWLQLELPTALSAALDKLTPECEAWFDLTKDEKQQRYPSSHDTECGYYVVAGEKEYLTIRRASHQDSPLEQKASLVWNGIATLLHRILCDICRAGGYDTRAFDHLLGRCLNLPGEAADLDEVTTLMRLFRYCPHAGTAAQHVDIGLLTLCVGTGKGLQVLDKSLQPHQWVDVDGPVVLAGEFLRVLLRSRVRAGMHRVVSNPEGRSSVVFALRPELVGSTDLGVFGGKGVEDTKILYERIKGSKWNINAKKDVREQQRCELQRRREQYEVLAEHAGMG